MKNGCQCSLPSETQCFAHGEGNERVFSHVRCDGERPISVEGHEVASGDGNQHCGYKRWAFRDSGGRQDSRVNYHNVGHGGKGCEASDHLAREAGPVTIKTKVRVEAVQESLRKQPKYRVGRW